MANTNDPRRSGHDTESPETRSKPDAARDDSRAERRVISGPGAADFIAAVGGVDTPESDPAKGTAVTRGEGLANISRFTPNLDEPRPETERERRGPDKGTT